MRLGCISLCPAPETGPGGRGGRGSRTRRPNTQAAISGLAISAMVQEAGDVIGPQPAGADRVTALPPRPSLRARPASTHSTSVSVASTKVVFDRPGDGRRLV